MSKSKAPLLSLRASGTIADTLTYQRRSGVNFTRRKPIPAQPRTLPQMYQRWLYQDYVEWWHEQSAATKQTWETNARPYHMTGFAYWMSNRLTLLPDIVAWYRFDNIINSTAIDFSKNEYDGTVIGAIPATLGINGALSFDGVNDIVNCAPAPKMADLTDKVTVEALIYLYGWGELDMGRIIDCGGLLFFVDDYGPNSHPAEGLSLIIGATDVLYGNNNGLWLRDIIHVAGRADGTYITLLINGLLHKSMPQVKSIGASANLYIGNRLATDRTFYGIQDNVIIYNRALSDAAIKRHSERRYPL